MKKKSAVFLIIISAVLIALSVVLYTTNHNYDKCDKIRILCYGDSNTYGYDPNTLGGRYDEEKIWPSLLEKELGEGYETINCGVSGLTTAYDALSRSGGKNDTVNGLKRLPGMLEGNFPMDIVIIMLGANDCNVGMNLTVDEICDGLKAVVNAIRAECMENQGYEPVIIIGVPQAYAEGYENSPLSYQMDYESYVKTHALSEAYKDVAGEMGCYYLDASTKYEISDIDSQHLTLKGHKELAKDYAKLIKKALQN